MTTANYDHDNDGDTDTVPGGAIVSLKGSGRAGTATVTVTSGDLDPVTIDFVMSGPATKLTATPRQGSVEIGGKVWVELQLTDAGGNPIQGTRIDPVSSKEVVGPTDKAIPVAIGQDTDGNDPDDGYNVDYIHSTDATKNIPACGNDRTDTDSTEDGVQQTFATDGTNADGKCVVQVTATDAAGTKNDATRGAHTLNFASGDLKASTKIVVSGPPATITSDAPATLAPSDEVKVTVTVVDDASEPVGAVKISVIQTAGDGAIVTEMAAKTSDGEASFSYLAPSTPGVVEFLVRTRDSDDKVTAKLPIVISVEAPAPPEPEPPAMGTLSGSGSIRWYTGGSVSDLAAVLADACPGGHSIAVEDSSGTWQFHSSSAPAFVNAIFEAAFPDGFSATGVWVTSCSAGNGASMAGDGPSMNGDDS